MENNKDLEEFRKQWKYELNRNKLPVDEKSKRPNLSSDDRSRSSNCDTDKDKTTGFHHSVFGVEESKKRPNTYQSFLLAEDLLKQDDSQIHETYSSNVLRRKRSSCDLKDLNSSSTSSQDVALSPEPKVPKSDDKNTAQSKERFLDIFLADLVSEQCVLDSTPSKNDSENFLWSPTLCTSTTIFSFKMLFFLGFLLTQ